MHDEHWSTVNNKITGIVNKLILHLLLTVINHAFLEIQTYER